MRHDRPKPKLAPIAATALVLTTVGGIGLWARGAPADVPLKIEPAPQTKAGNAFPARVATPPSLSPTPSTGPQAISRRILVHVSGAVSRPGVYTFGPEDRVADAIRQAGGALATGAPDELNLAEPLQDGQKLIVPSAEELAPMTPSLPMSESDLGEVPAATTRPARSSRPRSPRVRRDRVATVSSGRRIASPAPAPLLPGSISLSRATLADLDRLPGVGPATAEKILAERHRRGGFGSIDDLLDVSGIGPAKLAKMRPYLSL